MTIPRMSLSEFKRRFRSDTPVPLVVTVDGEDAFALMSAGAFLGKDNLVRVDCSVGAHSAGSCPFVPPDLARDT